MFSFAKNEGVATVAVIVAVAFVVGVISIFVAKKEDGVVEEISEDVVENQLGLPRGSLDWTPTSPEDK